MWRQGWLVGSRVMRLTGHRPAPIWPPCLADGKALATGSTNKAGSQHGMIVKLKTGGTIEWR